jgi:hypothetical protein
MAIYPESERKFFYAVIDAQITFVTEGSDSATGLIFHYGGQDTSAKRVE